MFKKYSIDILGSSYSWQLNLRGFASVINDYGLSDEGFIKLITEANEGIVLALFKAGFKQCPFTDTELYAIYLSNEGFEVINEIVLENAFEHIKSDVNYKHFEDLDSEYDPRLDHNVLDEDPIVFNIGDKEYEWFFNMKTLSKLLRDYKDLEQNEILELIINDDFEALLSLFSYGIHDKQIDKRFIEDNISYYSFKTISLVLKFKLPKFLTPIKDDPILSLEEAMNQKSSNHRFNLDTMLYMAIKEMNITEDMFWSSSPRKFYSLVEAHVEITNIKNGEEPRRREGDLLINANDIDSRIDELFNSM